MTKVTKKRIEKAIVGSGGILTTIAKRCLVSRTTLYTYLDKNKKYNELIEHERESMLDAAEDSLFSQVKKKSPWATKFILSTLGKKRGYVERQEISQQTQDNRLTSDQFSDAWKEEGKKNKDTKRTKGSNKKP